MSFVATAVIGGGVIAAGGAIGGAALAASGAKGARDATLEGTDASPYTDPLFALSALNEQVRMGFVDPTVLAQASPLSQALANALRDPRTIRQRDWLLQGAAALRDAMANGTVDQLLQNWWQNGNLHSLSAIMGVSTEDLIAQEQDYQTRIKPILEQAKAAAAPNFARRLQIQDQITRLAEGVVGQERIPELEAQFKELLTRDINRQADEQRLDLLRTGNFGNFNPGRAVGDVEEARFDAMRMVDTDALIRATQVLASANAATGSQANVLQGILGTANPNLIAAAQQFSAPTIAGVQADNKGAILGQGIAQGAGSFGSSISLLGLLNSKPATT